MDATPVSYKDEDRSIRNDLGQVRTIHIPPGWAEASPSSPWGPLSLLREFYPSDLPAVRLGFFYRGMPVSDSSGSLFRQILDQGQHALSPAEFTSLREVLRTVADDQVFDLASAKVQDLNGKLVLIVRGIWREKHMHHLGIFVAADPEATRIQEITFTYPDEHSSKFAKEGESAIYSIVWVAIER